MREPRFRAWIERYQKYMPVAMIHFEPILGKIDYIEVVATGGDWCKFYPEEYILEQYTGLEDKNGKEIYEGDIVNEFVCGVKTFKGEAFRTAYKLASEVERRRMLFRVALS